MHVLDNHGDTLGVDGAQDTVLKEPHEVSFTGLLQPIESARLEARVTLLALRNFSDEALERRLADEALRSPLELADVAQCHCYWAIPADGLRLGIRRSQSGAYGCRRAATAGFARVHTNGRPLLAAHGKAADAGSWR